ncbi:Calx-beta domain-containing protein [Thalassotalea psychrophila]|uniref:Calx-beta domain-containing protein n=1 Tax=Thalassotalea psychrophila TaxID=3065647 RepID=A0ABY9TW96_9GAMM|nr:Calx-beta domain-containing protein [Colwelliaceae bacterium SQ149]
MSIFKTSGLSRKTINKLLAFIGILMFGVNVHAVQASEAELAETLAGINAGLSNVELELFEWPSDLHNQLGKIDKFAFVTRPRQSSGKLPLIISLHGGGESFQNLNLETQLGMDVPRGWNLAELVDKEVMFLDPSIHEGWEPDTLDKMLDYVLENFSDIDKHRVYVMGYSRGGGGTYDWIRQSGDRFAAAAPTGFSSYRETHDLTMLENLPIWTAVGSADNDSAQRATKVKAFADHLEALGNENVDYRSYSGAGHNAGGQEVYSAVELVDFMLEFTLSHQPEDWVTADQIDWFWQEGGEPTFPNEAYGPEVLVDPDKLPSGVSNVGDNQLFDVWVPDGVGPFPVYVYAHGGGFTGGSKRRMVLSGPLLQNDNVVYVDTNYRLHGGTSEGITDAINDVVALLEFLKTNKEKYKINPDQIFLGGGSAGGIIMNDITYKQKVAGIKGLWQWNLYRNEGQSVNLQDQELLANVAIPVVHGHPDLYPNDNSHSALDAFDHASANWQAGSRGTFFKAIKEHPSAIGYEDPYDQIEQVWIDGHWELDSRDGTDTGVRMPNLAEWIYKVVESNNEGEIPDAGQINFGSIDYLVSENEDSVLITVTRTDGEYGELKVDYSLQDGTATATSDYEYQAGTLTFTDGEISKQIIINIVDDSTYEGDETFNISLSNLVGDATLGNPSTATVTIIDIDAVPPAGILQFSGESYSVNESAGSVTITVQRIDGDYGDVSVDYAVANGSGINGNDYSVTDGTLYFSNGEMSQTINIDITDDTLDENTETFSVILSNPISATLGNNQTANVSIIDNDVPASNDDDSNSSSGGSFDYWLMIAMLLIVRRRMLGV